MLTGKRTEAGQDTVVTASIVGLLTFKRQLTKGVQAKSESLLLHIQ